MKKLLILLVFMMVVLFGFIQGVSAQENVDLKKIDMIEFVEKMERTNLEELVLQLVADSLNISVYEMLENPEQGVAVVQRMKMKDTDDLAKSTLWTLSVAAETFAVSIGKQGKFPLSIEDLTEDIPPFLSKGYCGETIEGFKYDCDFSSDEYRFVATPEVFVVTTGGLWE